jgi:CRISPR-associated protein Cas2
MRVLLIYDIPHDGARQKVADACLDHGLERIQYSAFVGELSRAHQRSNIQLIPIDATSWEARRVLQQGEVSV